MKKLIKKTLFNTVKKVYKISNEDIINENKWIYKLNKIYDKFEKISKKIALSICSNIYIDKICNDVNEDNKHIFIKNIIDSLYDLSDNFKLALLYILYYCKLIDDDIVEKYMKYAMKTDNEIFRYWFTMDISKITFLLQKGFYNDYYNDRKKLLEMIYKDCNINLPLKSKSKAENKLCIVTYCLEPSIYQSVQRVAMMISNGLIKYYDEILIVVLDSFCECKKDKEKWHSIFEREFSVKYKKEIEKMFEDKVKVSFVHIEEYKKRYQEAIDIIYEFNPKVILDMSDEYSIISYAYYKDFTTFNLPLRNNISSLFFNYLLGNIELCKKLNYKFNCIDIKKVCNWNFPEYVPKIEKTFSREEIGISPKKFVILTIGNNDRVIDREFSDKICKLLKANERIMWILVGGNAIQYIHKEYSELFENGKIIEWGFEKNLAGLCAIGDIVLRPNTTGSSGATAIAAQQGLPIVMTNFLCDPMRWLGNDYSKIDNYDDLMKEVIHLYEDKYYYKKMQNIVLKKIQEATDEEKIWKELSEILQI